MQQSQPKLAFPYRFVYIHHDAHKLEYHMQKEKSHEVTIYKLHTIHATTKSKDPSFFEG